MVCLSIENSPKRNVLYKSDESVSNITIRMMASCKFTNIPLQLADIFLILLLLLLASKCCFINKNWANSKVPPMNGKWLSIYLKFLSLYFFFYLHYYLGCNTILI